MTRAEQLANAIVEVTKIDHYMIGIVEKFTYDELHDATQMLIERQNYLVVENSPEWFELDRALDYAEQLHATGVEK